MTSRLTALVQGSSRGVRLRGMGQHSSLTDAASVSFQGGGSGIPPRTEDRVQVLAGVPGLPRGTQAASTQAAEEEDTFSVQSGVDLETDVLHKVLSMLDHRSLAIAGAACRQWHQASMQPDFWRHVDLKGAALNPQALVALCSRHPHMESLNLTDCLHGRDDLAVLISDALPLLLRLTSLALGGSRIPTLRIEAVAAGCPSLRVLRVSNASLGFDRLALQHERLQEVELVSCNLNVLQLTCPALLQLSLRGSQAYAVELRCPTVRTLDLSHCTKLSEASLQQAATSCPQLAVLRVAGCSCVTDDTLCAVGEHCQQLQELDASECSHVSLDRIPSWPRLQTLILRRCSSVSAMSMRLITACCPSLRTLALDACQPLATATLETDSLQHVSLVGCTRLTEVVVKSADLEELDLGGCHALRKVDLMSLSLRAFSLHQQMFLSHLSLSCPGLRRLSLSDCPSLTDSLFESLAAPAACRCLVELRLENCEGLTAVDLQAHALILCSLRGCTNVATLRLRCASLRSLHLEGCDHLQQAHLENVLLSSLNLGICPRLRSIAIHSPSLHSLDLGGCGSLSELSLNCPALRSLDSRYCQSLTDNALLPLPASCPSIASLVLASCPGLGTPGLACLGSLKHLTSLDLSYTFLRTLEPVFESCTGLCTLKLSACKYLHESCLLPLSGYTSLPDASGASVVGGEASGDGGVGEVALPLLTELDLSYTCLSAAAAEHLLRHCRSLQHVSLNGWLNATDAIWQCLSEAPSESVSVHGVLSSGIAPRALKSLTLVGCSRLRQVELVDGQACSDLTDLNLTWARCVSSVRICSPSLQTLHLSKCESLVGLSLECPALTSLFLQGCAVSLDTVADAVSGCSALETLDLRHCAQVGRQALPLLRRCYPHLKRVYT